MDSKEKILLIDGVCNFCIFTVKLVTKLEKTDVIQFANIQDDFGKEKMAAHGINPGDLTSLVYIYDGAAYRKSDAVLKIAKELRFPFNLISHFSFIPLGIRNFFYDLVAKNRYRIFGKREVCFLPNKKLQQRFKT